MTRCSINSLKLTCDNNKASRYNADDNRDGIMWGGADSEVSLNGVWFTMCKRLAHILLASQLISVSACELVLKNADSAGRGVNAGLWCSSSQQGHGSDGRQKHFQDYNSREINDCVIYLIKLEDGELEVENRGAIFNSCVAVKGGWGVIGVRTCAGWFFLWLCGNS